MPRRRVESHRIIVSEADIRDGVRALRRKCRFMRSIHDRTGDPPLRRREAGFAGLARIIVGQQVSIASAGAIWSRLESVLAPGPLTAPTVLAAGEDALRRAGLSGPKIRALTAAAEAVMAGRLRFDDFDGVGEASVRDALVAVHGIGPWTADIFIMFCLGRADGFAPGDLALQVAAQQACGLEARPSPQQLMELAENWRPWRGVAARLLWSYYAARKSAAAAMPV